MPRKLDHLSVFAVLALLLCGALAVAQTGPSKPSVPSKPSEPSKPSTVAPSGKEAKPQAAGAKSPAAATGPVARVDSSKEKDAGLVMMTPAREAAALTFAGRHHPQLAELLTQLKKSNPPEYERAMQELFRTSERLAKTQEKFPDRYETELSQWKVDSRIRLLAARLAMSDDPALEQQLRAALLERVDLRIQQNQQERDRIAARLDKLDETLADLRRDREEMANKEFTRLKNNMGAMKPKAKKPAKDNKDNKDKTNKAPVPPVKNTK